MISEVRKRIMNDIFKLNGNVYAFDFTTIDLYLKLFHWDNFRTHEEGIKVHTLYDVETKDLHFPYNRSKSKRCKD